MTPWQKSDKIFGEWCQALRDACARSESDPDYDVMLIAREMCRGQMKDPDAIVMQQPALEWGPKANTYMLPQTHFLMPQWALYWTEAILARDFLRDNK